MAVHHEPTHYASSSAAASWLSTVASRAFASSRELAVARSSGRLPLALWMVLAVFGASPALAGGLYIQEFMDSTMGVAAAGSQAVAMDASTAFHNPAGMPRLEHNELTMGVGALGSVIRFNPDPDSPVSGNNGGNAGGWAPILSSKYAHKITDDLSAGFSFLSVSGAVLDYDDEWTGRYQNQEVDLLTLSAIPTVAYRLNDWLSIGGGLNMLYARLDMKVALPLPGGDGRVKIDDADDFDVGFIGGILVEPAAGTRFGLTYWSKVEPKLDGDVKIQPPGAQAGIEVGFPLAETLRLGAYHELNDQWALLGSVRWENWSEFDKLPITTDRGSTKADTGWGDTFGASIGVHYRPAEKWLLQAGFGYDSNPVSDRHRNAAIAIDRQLRYAAGIQYDLSESLNVGGSFVYADYGKNKIDSDNLQGDYKNYDLFFIGLNLNYKFGVAGTE